MSAPEPGRPRGVVLVVDDDALLRSGIERSLVRRGWTVVTAADGRDAKELYDQQPFDVIVSDVHMSGYGGLQFLRTVRERDPNLPVILMTGKPSVDLSVRAIEHGVFRLMVKPVQLDTLDELLMHAVKLRRLALLKERALEVVEALGPRPGERTQLTESLTRALDTLRLTFQPIVSWSRKQVAGSHALLTSAEPELTTQAQLRHVAERLGRSRQLGRAARALASAYAAGFAKAGQAATESFAKAGEAATNVAGAVRLFLDLHASDLADEELLDPRAPLSQVAEHVVLAVSDRASLATFDDVAGKASAVKRMGYTLAIDELGTGYAGLSSLSLLEPSIVTLAPALIRHVDDEPRKQSVVAAIYDLCRELGITIIAAGVETTAERDALATLGADLMHGGLFASDVWLLDPP